MQRILIIGPAWIGDMVMAQTLFQVLKLHHPDSLIDVLAPDWTKPLLQRMPEINRAFSLPLKHGEFNFRKRWQIAKELKKENYDQAIVLPNSWKSALIPFLAKVPVRTGWRGEMRWGLLNDVRYLDKQKLPLMIQRFMALGVPKNSPLPPNIAKPSLSISSVQRQQTIQRYELDKNLQQPILALCPGAEFGPSKRWRAEYFAEVAQTLLKNNWQVWLFGSPKDREAAEVIQKYADNNCIDLIGKTSLSDAIDLLSFATLVISNDTGLMHIAAALQRKLIVLYGSSDPGFTPPLSDDAEILSIELSCRPCFQRTCPLKHHRCMTELLPERVLQAIHYACLTR